MNQIEYANQAYRKKEYAISLKIYASEAHRGNLECARIAAWMFLDGLGVEADFEKALELFNIASKDGDIESIFGQAKCLMKMRRMDESIAILKELCNVDYAPANYWMGKLYSQGLWLDKNEDLALHHFCEAAKKKHLYSSREEAIRLLAGQKGALYRFLGVWKMLNNIVNAIEIGLGKGSEDPRWLI